MKNTFFSKIFSTNFENFLKNQNFGKSKNRNFEKSIFFRNFPKKYFSGKYFSTEKNLRSIFS